MGDAELRGPTLYPEQMIDLTALIWFSLANRDLRRALSSGDERRIARWTDRLGITDDRVIPLWRQIISDNKRCFTALACRLADEVCPDYPCDEFLKIPAMEAIRERMHEVIHPGPEPGETSA